MHGNSDAPGSIATAGLGKGPALVNELPPRPLERPCEPNSRYVG
jgi:hypothetical protein